MPGEDHSFRIPDRQALTSVCAFNLGAFLCRLSSRFGRHGPRTRAWLVGSSIAMAALTLIAACVLIGSGETDIAADRGDPGWTSARGFLALAFLSASVGLQGAVAARLGTPFATTGASRLPRLCRSCACATPLARCCDCTQARS